MTEPITTKSPKPDTPAFTEFARRGKVQQYLNGIAKEPTNETKQ